MNKGGRDLLVNCEERSETATRHSRYGDIV